MRRWLRQYRVDIALALLVAALCFGRAFMAWPGTPIGSEAMAWADDPDVWLRLTLVRDWMEGGSWYSHAMTGSNAPYAPVESPWTRPLDMVIAWLASLMQGELPVRLIKAALLLPGIWVLLYVTGLLRAARRVLPHPDQGLMVCAVAACLPMMWNYFGVANADHHAPLAALFVWILSCLLAARIGAGDAVAVGAMLGLALWISPEALLLWGLVLGFLGLRFVAFGENGRALVLVSVSAALAGTLAMMAERRPEAWGVPVYDSISIVQVLAYALAAAGMVLLVWLAPKRREARLALALAVALAGAGVMGLCYPLFFHGAMVEADPYIFSDFLPRISEARPLWKQADTMRALAMTWQPLWMLPVLYLLFRKRPPLLEERVWWLLALFSAALIAACMVQMRWYYYLAPLLALVLGSMLAPLMGPQHPRVQGRWPARVLEGETPGFQAFVRQVVLVSVVLVPLGLLLFTYGKEKGNEVSLAAQGNACEALASAWIRSGGMVRDMGTAPRIVLTSTNLGTQLLYFTPQRIIASNYHREGKGIRYAWEVLAVTDMADLRGYLKERQVEALLLCPDATASENSVLMRVWQGKERVPAWMQRVEIRSMPHWRGLPKKPFEPKLFFIAR